MNKMDPTLLDIQGPLSELFKECTSQKHNEIEQKEFFKQLFAHKLSEKSYLQYIVDLHLIYKSLEEGIRRNLGDVRLKALYNKALERSSYLEKDIRSFSSENRISPSREGQEYAKHLSELAQKAPYLLIAHAYTRYLGDLSGGFVLKKQVEANFPGGHVAFYNFEDLLGVETPTRKASQFKSSWKATLDGLSFTPNERELLVKEAVKAFDFAGRLLATELK